MIRVVGQQTGTPAGSLGEPREEIAARTVNNERARSGESRQRSRDQLYNEAKKLGIEGRSKMNKTQLQRAVAGKKGS